MQPEKKTLSHYYISPAFLEIISFMFQVACIDLKPLFYFISVNNLQNKTFLSKYFGSLNKKI